MLLRGWLNLTHAFLGRVRPTGHPASKIELRNVLGIFVPLVICPLCCTDVFSRILAEEDIELASTNSCGL